MEEKATLIGSLVEKTEDYAKTSIELLKLQALDKSTSAISSLASIVIILISSLFIISMINIGAALWICQLMGNSYSGFFIVALFYAILSVVLYIFREEIVKTPISKRIITYVRKEKQI